VNKRGWVLLASWCCLLALGIVWVQSHLKVSADLRLFMPSPRTEEQRLLIQNIGESPASRLLLLAIDARKQRFPQEKSFVYQPLIGREDENRWNETTRATVLKNYNQLDMFI